MSMTFYFLKALSLSFIIVLIKNTFISVFYESIIIHVKVEGCSWILYSQSSFNPYAHQLTRSLHLAFTFIFSASQPFDSFYLVICYSLPKRHTKQLQSKHSPQPNSLQRSAVLHIFFGFFITKYPLDFNRLIASRIFLFSSFVI